MVYKADFHIFQPIIACAFSFHWLTFRLTSFNSGINSQLLYPLKTLNSTLNLTHLWLRQVNIAVTGVLTSKNNYFEGLEGRKKQNIYSNREMYVLGIL